MEQTYRFTNQAEFLRHKPVVSEKEDYIIGSVKHGKKKDLPDSEAKGVFLVTDDTNEIFLGNGKKNSLIALTSSASGITPTPVTTGVDPEKFDELEERVNRKVEAADFFKTEADGTKVPRFRDKSDPLTINDISDDFKDLLKFALEKEVFDPTTLINELKTKAGLSDVYDIADDGSKAPLYRKASEKVALKDLDEDVQDVLKTALTKTVFDPTELINELKVKAGKDELYKKDDAGKDVAIYRKAEDKISSADLDAELLKTITEKSGGKEFDPTELKNAIKQKADIKDLFTEGAGGSKIPVFRKVGIPITIDDLDPELTKNFGATKGLAKETDIYSIDDKGIKTPLYRKATEAIGLKDLDVTVQDVLKTALTKTVFDPTSIIDSLKNKMDQSELYKIAEDGTKSPLYRKLDTTIKFSDLDTDLQDTINKKLGEEALYTKGIDDVKTPIYRKVADAIKISDIDEDFKEFLKDAATKTVFDSTSIIEELKKKANESEIFDIASDGAKTPLYRKVADAIKEADLEESLQKTIDTAASLKPFDSKPLEDEIKKKANEEELFATDKDGKKTPLFRKVDAPLKYEDLDSTLQDTIKTALTKEVFDPTTLIEEDAKKVNKSDIVDSSVDTTAADYKPSDEKILSEKAVLNKIAERVIDKIDITAEAGKPVTTFVLTKTPNATPVQLFINHLGYFEDEDFTVDRKTKTVTWTATAAKGGLDIDSSTVKKLILVYNA